jgi:hypothetical protein
MDKEKLLEIFEELLKDWERAQSYVIQDTICSDDDYDHDDLEKDSEDYRKRFMEALQDAE